VIKFKAVKVWFDFVLMKGFVANNKERKLHKKIANLLTIFQVILDLGMC